MKKNVFFKAEYKYVADYYRLFMEVSDCVLCLVRVKIK